MAPERRWWVAWRGEGLFEVKVDDGDGFRPAATNEIYWVLRAGELSGAVDCRGRVDGSDDRRHATSRRPATGAAHIGGTAS